MQTKKWVIEKRKLSELKLLDNNPRIIGELEYQQLKKDLSLGKFKPFVIDNQNTILAGNQTYRVLSEVEGLDSEWDCSVPQFELTESERKKIIILDNRHRGEDDLEILANEFEEELKDLGFDDLLLEVDDLGTVEEDNYDIEQTKETSVVLGDIWQLGNHRLMCGDSMNIDQVEKLMDGQKVDMVFTDPPYQIGEVGGGILGSSKQLAEIKSNGVDSFDPSGLLLLANTSIFFHNKPLIKQYIELAEKWGVAYDLAIYKKPGLPNYKGHLMTDIEYIAIIGKLDPKKGMELEVYSKIYEGKKDTDNKLSYSKPVELCGKFIRLYSDASVLDLFGGSGSTLIACEQLNRKCYMMEIDPYYCQVIIDRWEKLTGLKAERINDGK